jgi:hypothetical protein
MLHDDNSAAEYKKNEEFGSADVTGRADMTEVIVSGHLDLAY